MMPLQDQSQVARSQVVRTADRLLDKWAIEERTSLDISTVYRKMKAGTFPQPVRIGKRRVAWSESDVAEWLSKLEVGTRVLCLATAAASGGPDDARQPACEGRHLRIEHPRSRAKRFAAGRGRE